VFFACDPASYEGRCATEKEIKTFFTNHFILTAQNTERFDAVDYSDDFIRKETKLDSLYLSQYISPRYFIDYQQYNVETNDSRLGLSAPKDTIYYAVETSRTGTIPDEYSKAYIAYWYQMSLHTVSQKRNVYTVLDWLGDIGGLLDALSLIAGTVISLVAGRILQVSLLSNIFLQRDYSDAQLERVGNPNKVESSTITVTWWSCFAEKLKHEMRCVCKARTTVSDRLLKKSSIYIEKQLDFGRFVRQQARYRSLLKAMASQTLWKLSRYSSDLTLCSKCEESDNEISSESEIDLNELNAEELTPIEAK